MSSGRILERVMCKRGEGMSEKGVSGKMIDILDELCNDYCKWNEKYGDSDEEFERKLCEKCNNCPISRL